MGVWIKVAIQVMMEVGFVREKKLFCTCLLKTFAALVLGLADIHGTAIVATVIVTSLSSTLEKRMV